MNEIYLENSSIIIMKPIKKILGANLQPFSERMANLACPFDSSKTSFISTYRTVVQNHLELLKVVPFFAFLWL